MEGDAPSEEQKSVSDIVFTPSSNTSEISSSKLLKHGRSILDALLSPVSSFTSESSDCKLQKDGRSISDILPPNFIFTCETPRSSLQKKYMGNSSDDLSSISTSVSKINDSEIQIKEENSKLNIVSASSSSSKTRNFEPRKHVAVILSSSESENESDGESNINVIDYKKACSGDAPETVKLATCDEVKIKNTHCTVIPDLDENGDCADDLSKIHIEKPRFSRQIDYDKWAKKKEKEARKKKIEEQKSKQNSETLIMDEESAKDNAWVNWMCKKKSDELQNKMQEIYARRTEEREQLNKQMIAKQKFEEWAKKKKEKFKTSKEGKKRSAILLVTCYRT
jgi:hypothetical protein